NGPSASSVMLSFPRLTAPASRRRCAAVHACAEVKYSGVLVPQEVGCPSRWQRSLKPTGTPWSGPRQRPAAASASRRRAERSAPSSSSVMKARMRPSHLPARSSPRSTASTGDSFPARMDSATAVRLSSSTGRRLVLAFEGRDEARRLLGEGELPGQPLDHSRHARPLRLLLPLFRHGNLPFAPTLADV